MRNHQRWFWGILFLIGAALLVASKMGLITYELGFWTIVAIGFAVVIFVKSLVYGSFPGMIFPVAVVAIIFAKPLGIEALSPWTILGAATLLSIGLSLIFHKNSSNWGTHLNVTHVHDDDENERVVYSRPNKKLKKSVSDFVEDVVDGVVDGEYTEVHHEPAQDDVKDTEDEQEHTAGESEAEARYKNTGKRKIVINSQLNSTVRYLKSDRLEQVNINNTLGETTVYFDQVQVPTELNIIVTNKFGDVDLYMPREWDVRITANSTFGSLDERGAKQTKQGPVVNISGSSAFGELTIKYI